MRRSWLIGITLSALCSCNCYLPHVKVEVVLPPLPDHWPPGIVVDSFTIRYPELTGEIVSIEVPGDTKSISLPLPKMSVVPVTALPELYELPEILRPAGGVFPWDSSGESSLYLTWFRGFAADLLVSLHPSGQRTQAVNVRKLHLAVLDESEGDPWSLDVARIRTAIQSGSLARLSVRGMRERAIDLPVGPGTWIEVNPCARTPFISGTESLSLDLYDGLHLFVREEDGEYLLLYIDRTGWKGVMPNRQYGLYGMW